VTDDWAPVARVERLTLWLLALFLLAASFTRKPEDVVASALGIAIAVPVAAVAVKERTRPHMAVTLFLIAGAGVLLVANGSPTSLGCFGLCLLALLCVLTAGPRLGYLFACAALAFLFVELARHGFRSDWLPWIGGVLVSALGGHAVMHEQRLLSALRAAQADLASHARMQERARIARELHDVIAHSLTVSLLHISAARMAVQHDPADADRALGEAERLGRESLDEVRAIVGLARADHGADGRSPLAPTPGLESLEALVERYRSAGARITVELGEGVEHVPATVSTTAYRITQEALTNAARHAAGQPVDLRLSAPDGSLELLVRSGGSCGEAAAGHGGHGLSTMRERAEAVGGVLEAGPQAAGAGWQVHASLPLRPGATNGRPLRPGDKYGRPL
jgi:signal transduction histidine kinase